jgi:4-amino-4-deoxy-L-arabinose transferase-like glycosyltransferase
MSVSAQTNKSPLLAVIVSIYVVLACLYSVVVPLFEASDELWHYPMVDYISNTAQLPVQDAAAQQAWRQEGSQPPLYYMLAAVINLPFETSNLEAIRRQNPHADIGLQRPDQNINMIVHRANLEAFPWQGATLAVHVVRLFSVILGAVTIIVTYRLGQALFPDQPVIAIGAALFNACLPMFLFVSGSVNNDNLSNLVGNLLTLMIVRLLLKRERIAYRTYAYLGIVTGIGLLAKLNIGFFIPIIAFSLFVIALRTRDWKPFVIGGVISGALTIAIAGWWYIRNVQLYGDPTGLNVFLDIVGRRAIPATLPQLWAERASFTQAFWGYFGGMNVPMPQWIYHVFDGIALFALASLLVGVIVRVTKRDFSRELLLPRAITVLWIAITFVSYLRWTAETPASQGRLMFGALSSILIWFTVGITWWLPRRAKAVTVSMVGLYFFGVALWAPFGVIAPAYARPDRIADRDAIAIFSDVDGRGIALQHAEILTPQVMPGEYVLINTEWHVARAVNRDWSLFVHLVSPDNVIIAQRDVYPAMGLIATSDLNTRFAWENPIAVFVPQNAYSPMTLTVKIGWYHLPTGERLRLDDDSELFTLGAVELDAPSSALSVPNPTFVNLGGQFALVGYTLSDLSPQVGGETTLTLYWQALQAITTDYTVFAHIIDPLTTTIFAGSDSQPVQGTRPTTTWQVGEIIEDVHFLNVSADAIPNIYELEIGAYTQTESGFTRLRVITADGGMANDYEYLTRVRIVPADDIQP